MGYAVGIIDDHQVVTEGLVRIFAGSEHDLLITVNDGKRLISALRTTTIDVLLLDLNINEDVFDIIDEIKRDFPKVKMVAFTSYDMPSLVSKVTSYGVAGYLLKDSSPEEIDQAINTVMQGKTYVSELIKTKINHQKSIDDDLFAKKNLLSSRELEILGLIAQGLSNKQMAEKLFISDRTAETHRKNIKRKLGMTATADLVKLAIALNLA